MHASNTAYDTDTPLQTWVGDGESSMTEQLHKHLADMTELCAQVKDARDECEDRGEDWCGLFDELIQTLEHHQSMIAGQLSEIRQTAADEFYEDATCVR
jgi:hypothetical protein